MKKLNALGGRRDLNKVIIAPNIEDSHPTIHEDRENPLGIRSLRFLGCCEAFRAT